MLQFNPLLTEGKDTSEKQLEIERAYNCLSVLQERQLYDNALKYYLTNPFSYAGSMYDSDQLKKYSKFTVKYRNDIFNKSWKSVLPEPNENLLEYIVGGFFAISIMQEFIFLILFISIFVSYVWLLSVIAHP